mmetsp:Transcript_63136/g.138246  ORF Transcript_63136/g.138246 Transcript_63136/m.138246 type:complete len:149 (+) Transcript_63136:33-479(+)
MALPHDRSRSVRADGGWKELIRKDMALRTMESIHGMAACYSWPRHVVGFKRSREGGEGTEAQLAAMRPKMNQVGPHASEITAHGLIIGNQPKLLPAGPRVIKIPEAMESTEVKSSHCVSPAAEKPLPKDVTALSIWDDRSWGEYQPHR